MIDNFCKGLQDAVRDEVDMFLASLVALSPSTELEPFYTYSAYGLKDLFDGSKPFRLVTVAVTGGEYVYPTDVIKATLVVVFDSSINDERATQANVAVPNNDQFGQAHANCYAAFFEWFVSRDWSPLLLDAGLVPSPAEDADASLVDVITIVIYFNPPS